MNFNKPQVNWKLGHECERLLLFYEYVRQMVLVSTFEPKTGMGLSCAIYKMLLNFSLSLERKPNTGNPNKWYGKFRLFR